MQIGKNWTKALKTAKEFKLQPLNILEGKIPLDLNGSLYRNGPGRLERGGEIYGHWFDGDGAVLGVHFRNGKAEGTYQYAKSKEFLEEEKAGKPIYLAIGKKSKRGLLNDLMNPASKNPNNTSVLLVKNKLLALCEGGWPFAMDPKTLDSIGPDNLGQLVAREMYSAHPKVDPDTGEIFNHGQIPYPSALCVYKSNKDGKIVKKNQIKIRGMTIIHDCVLAGKYLVVFNPPTKINFWKMVLGIEAYNDCIQYDPQLGTEVYIFDRNDLSLVTKFTTEPFYSFHFVNGYEEKDGNIYVEFAKFENFTDIWAYVREFPLGNQGVCAKTAMKPRLTSMRIDPKQGKMIEMKNVGDEHLAEFPTVADSLVGKNWRYSLYATSPPQKKNLEVGETFQTIGRLDRKNDKLQKFYCGPHCYINEPLLVSSKEDPEEGYILNLIFDSQKEASELWIHNTKSFEGEPICKIGLPEIIPFGFHGRYYSA